MARAEEAALWDQSYDVHTRSNQVQKLINPLFEAANFKKNIPEEGRPPSYTIKSRVKGVADIRSKVERKRKDAKEGSDEYNYDPNHVTDGCGFRIVTLFQDDMLLVINELVRMFKHEKPFTDNPICEITPLKEAIIYTNRPNNEGELHNKISKFLIDAGFATQTKEPENRKSGYSSIHFVVWVRLDDESKQAMEIQVRDIFEEAWGEVDHSLRYVNDREEDDNNDVFSTWKPHLNALKAFADGCSQHANIIKTNAIDLMNARKTYSEEMPAEKIEDAVSILSSGLPAEFTPAVEKAYSALKVAHEAYDHDVRTQGFRSAKKQFEELTTSASNFLKEKTSDGRDVEYRLLMEIAYCTLINDDETLIKVKELYDSLIQRYPNDAVAYYRYGSVLVRTQADIDTAIDALNKAISLLKDDVHIDDDSWLHSAIYRQLGYAIWNKADICVSPDEKKSFLYKAIETTERAIKEVEERTIDLQERRKAINNLTYYYYDALCLADSKETPEANFTKLKKYLIELEAINENKDVTVINRWHTIMKCYQLLGDMEKVSNYAVKLGQRLLIIAREKAENPNLRPDQVRNYIDKRYYEVHDEALEIIFSASSCG